MSNVQTAWEQVRSHLIEIAKIVQPLSDDEKGDLADIIDYWMEENPIQ